MFFRKRYFKKAFKWGKREHTLEKLTNKLLVNTLLVGGLALITRSVIILYVLIITIITTTITHLLARWCHRKEKKYHKKARS